MHIADVFNVKHLIPFTGDSSSDEDDAAADSRSNLFYPGGNDAVQIEDVLMQNLAYSKLSKKCLISTNVECFLGGFRRSEVIWRVKIAIL